MLVAAGKGDECGKPGINGGYFSDPTMKFGVNCYGVKPDPDNNNIKSIIKDRKSWLCVGLDISPDKLGSEDLNVLKDHTYKVIDATRDFAVAYKPNFAFYERWGAAGFTWLEETVSYIGTDYMKIADAKRGDIGNTAEQYAESIFNHFNFDCVTLNPYMGKDSIEPFLNKPEKGVFILCRTSNPSAKELQNIVTNGIPIYSKVAKMAEALNKNNNVGLVVGSTAYDELVEIRKIVCDLPLLIPGVGAQGGDLEHSLQIGNTTGVALINISRGISFAGDMTRKTIYEATYEYVSKMHDAFK